jgi:branched-chain amino acid aminotransferase
MPPVKKLDKIWVDGALVAWDDATEHMLAHTLHYGVGAFEGIRAYQRKSGKTAVFRLREHIDRLFESCHIATLDVPFSRQQVIDACLEVLRANKLPAGYLRPLVYLGYGALGLGTLDAPVRTVVAAFEWGAYLGDEGLRNGIRCKVSAYRRGNIDGFMSKGKICGQYVTSVLAKRDAIKSGMDEAIMLDAAGLVTEGTGENIFMVKNGVIRTPPTSASILAGITRDTVITLARELGYDLREQSFTRDELWIADEVFLTGTAAEITPVREIDGRRVGAGEPGPVTRRVQERFFQVVRDGEGLHPEWLTYV